MKFLKSLLKKASGGEKNAFRCEKCGKEKERSKGIFVLGGSSFCCKQCCDTSAVKKSDVCGQC